MFKHLRLFLIISAIGVVVTTTLLTLTYRHIAILATDSLAQASSLALAQTALIAARQELHDYLTLEDRGGHKDLAAQRLAARLNEVVKESARGGPSRAVRVNLFNRQGVVIFSTDHDQLGQNQFTNVGFRSAINGRVVSNLVYRDVFNRFGRNGTSATARPFHPAEVANLMETYVPVRASATESVDAVFESYIDVSPLVAQNQRVVLLVLAGGALLLLLLYAVLILAARSAHKAIQAQQHNISERAAALEMVSAKMLSSGEMEKKRLAFGLHEGLAQTLVTIKMRIERKIEQFAAGETRDESLASIVPLLQSAIDDVETIATGLRPSSLDELGLLPTIDWFCREFDRLHPEIRVTAEIAVQESDVPAPLKIVIYRIIETALMNIARYENTDQIELALRLEDGAITLAIDDTSQDSRYVATMERDADSELQGRFGEAQERTTLSGGKFTIARGKASGVTLRATWTV